MENRDAAGKVRLESFAKIMGVVAGEQLIGAAERFGMISKCDPVRHDVVVFKRGEADRGEGRVDDFGKTGVVDEVRRFLAREGGLDFGAPGVGLDEGVPRLFNDGGNVVGVAAAGARVFAPQPHRVFDLVNMGA